MSGWRDSPLFHPQTVLRQLNAFRHHNLHCDVTISVAGTRFRCHRAVLAANSVFFHHLLLPSNRIGQPEQCYHLEWMGAATFSALLQYMYTSQLFLSDEHTARDLLHGARRVGLIALVDLVADYLLDTDGSEDRTEPSAGEEGGDPPSGNDAGEEGVPADDRPAGKEDPTFNLELLEPADPGYHHGSVDALPQEPADPGYHLGSVDALPQEPADPGYHLGSVDALPQEPADPGCKLDIVPQEPAVEPAGGVPIQSETEPMHQVMTCLQNLSQLFSTNGRHALQMVTANNSDHIRHNHSYVDQPASCTPPGVGQDEQRSANPDDPKEQMSGNSVDLREQTSVNPDNPTAKEQRSVNSDDPKRQSSGNCKEQSRKRGWLEGGCKGVCSATKRLQKHHFCHRAHQRKENMKKSLPLKVREECPDCKHMFYCWKDWTRHQRRHKKYQVCPKCGKLDRLGLHRERTQFVCETCRKCFIGKGHMDRHISRHLAQESRVPFKCTKCKRMFVWN